jgi:two-component system, OmpR family, phosphate regulon response regulator PhoB
VTGRILIVEPEKRLGNLLRLECESAGYEVDHAGSIKAMEAYRRKKTFDLILLSAMPVCLGEYKKLSANIGPEKTAVIALVASGEEALQCVDAGARDFLVKPIEIAELLARIYVNLRYIKPISVAPTLRAADIKLDRRCHRVWRADCEMHLASIDFRILEFLMQTPERVSSRTELRDFIWGTNSNVDIRTVDVHIGRLRKALRIDNRNDPIRTVVGAGYAVRASEV